MPLGKSQAMVWGCAVCRIAASWSTERRLRQEAVEEEHKARVHAQRIKNRLDIEAQIQYKDSLARKQKEDARQAWEDALQAEKDYQSMIDFDAAQARPAVPNYGRKSTAWYH